MSDMPNIVGLEYLVPILRKDLKTLKQDASRKPDTLPPRWRPPGCVKVLFREDVVISWVKSYGEQPKKRGRASGAGV